MARPHKPSELRALEGNRSRRAIPPDMPLAGVPECPDVLTGEARRHFNFLAAELSAIGVTKRLDTEGLSLLAWTWGQFWELATLVELDCGNVAASKLALDFQKAWWAAASKMGIPVVDRARIMAMVKPEEKVDEDEERFFKVTG
jgi:phage terminase small subunit